MAHWQARRAFLCKLCTVHRSSLRDTVLLRDAVTVTSGVLLCGKPMTECPLGATVPHTQKYEVHVTAACSTLLLKSMLCLITRQAMVIKD